MWVQLKTTQTLEIHGKPQTFYPGDWVDVGKQFATQLLADNRAQLYDEKQIQELKINGVTICLIGNQGKAIKTAESISDCVLVNSSPAILGKKTIVWDTSINVSAGYLLSGAMLLDVWELAVPLFDYGVLAQNVGDDVEREKTKRIVHDLRIPLYDTRLMFVKKTTNTKRLFSLWLGEVGHPYLSFLRVLYQVKPYILPLPCHWAGSNAPH